MSNNNLILFQDPDYVFKLIFIGRQGVGKTSFLNRYTEGKWEISIGNTVGVDFKIKTLINDGKIVKLHFWDTAGLERFRTLCNTYYRGCHGVFIMFDVTDEQSFKDADEFLDDISKHASENVKKILVGTKSDMNEKREVTYDQAKAYAQEHGMNYIETSAKENLQIDETVLSLINSIRKNKEIGQRSVRIEDKNNIRLSKATEVEEKKSCGHFFKRFLTKLTGK